MSVSEAQKKATAKFEKEAYDKVLVRFQRGTKEKIKAAAEASGESLNAFIAKSVLERLENKKIWKTFWNTSWLYNDIVI